MEKNKNQQYFNQLMIKSNNTNKKIQDKIQCGNLDFRKRKKFTYFVCGVVSEPRPPEVGGAGGW